MSDTLRDILTKLGEHIAKDGDYILVLSKHGKGNQSLVATSLDDSELAKECAAITKRVLEDALQENADMRAALAANDSERQ